MIRHVHYAMKENRSVLLPQMWYQTVLKRKFWFYNATSNYNIKMMF